MFSQPRSACVTPTPLLPHAWQTVKQVRNFSTLYTDHIRIEQELVYPLVEAGLTPESAENMGGARQQNAGVAAKCRSTHQLCKVKL